MTLSVLVKSDANNWSSQMQMGGQVMQLRKLSLEDEIPNPSTFSINSHGRFRCSDLFCWLFNEVLRRCMDAGLVKGEGFAVVASIIKADASRQRGVPGDEQVSWSDPALSICTVHEYLEALDEEALAETLPKRLSLTDP